MLPYLKNFLYRIGLGQLLYALLFRIQKIRNHKRNRAFKKNNPDFILPPDRFLFETFRLEYQQYAAYQKEVSKELMQLFRSHHSTQVDHLNILDWGCGTGGIAAGVKKIVGPNSSVFACDVSNEMITWNKQHIPGVEFTLIDPVPPTDYSADYFDFIYGISIFTHLNLASHYAWIAELHRVLKRGGTLIFTTHGSAYRSKLTSSEQTRFEKGQPIIREFKNEGSRNFASFHPPRFIHTLITDKFQLLDFFSGESHPELIGDQDKWVVRKKLE